MLQFQFLVLLLFSVKDLHMYIQRCTNATILPTDLIPDTLDKKKMVDTDLIPML